MPDRFDSNGKARVNLRREGEEVAVGAWHSCPVDLGTAVETIPGGKGRITVSTLDLGGRLSSADTRAEVARRPLYNFLAFAGITNKLQQALPR